MNDVLDSREELVELDQAWSAIDDPAPQPRTILQIIEFSLGKQRRAEVYVTRLLAYLLYPQAPHGMGGEFLQAFLRGLPESCGFDEATHDVSDVRVKRQATVEISDADAVDDGATEWELNPTRTGDVDLLIQLPNEWYLLIELKFSAPEGAVSKPMASQTEFYVLADTVDGSAKAGYDSGGYYLYLHEGDPATSPQFSNWTWQDFIDDVVSEFVERNAPRFPQRTATQLRELVDDIRVITNMTDLDQADEAEIELYLEHVEAIEAVRDTFGRHWEMLTNNWGSRLADRLQNTGADAVLVEPEDVVGIAIDVADDSVEDERWYFQQRQRDWSHVFKNGWWLQTDEEFTPVARRGPAAIRIGFHHRMDRDRQLAVQEQTLRFHFRNMGSNDQEFIDAFHEAFKRRSDSIEKHLPQNSELTGEKRDLIVSTYQIDVDEHGDFFEAYVAALQEAFESFIVDDRGALNHIEDAFQDAISEVYK